MKKITLLCLTFLTLTVTAQQTYVPDNNFEQALIDLGYDTVLDGYVTTANINTVTSLNVSAKNIATLTGIQDFVALTTLNCSNNSLIDLDVSSNTTLWYLYCSDNSITNLNLISNTVLKKLRCFNNALTNLDISSNTTVREIHCGNNQLENLNVKNGNNTNFIIFSAHSNPNLSCIKVDDITYSTNNWINIDYQSYFSTDCIKTYVPDNNFEQALINLGYDTVLDDYVLTENINTHTMLDVSNNNISDLTGIQDFVALTLLKCTSNSLTSIDVSTNTALTELSCFNNSLTSLDVSTNTNLTLLKCQNNPLMSLDVSANTALTELWCFNNSLTSLDVSTNTNLTELWCYGNSLTSLDVSTNTALISLRCAINSLTSLDVSTNTILTEIYCSDNQLTSLNIKNGNNTNIIIFNATNNPNLSCIEVDDATWSAANWTNIDTASSFSSNCTAPQTYIADTNFEAFLEANGMGNSIANDNYVTTSNINSVTSLNVSAQGIFDLTGIEDFIALTTLRCNDNQLTSLNISQNITLTDLRCQANNLTAIDVTQNTALTRFWCLDNQLTSLDVSQNVLLDDFSCNNNFLTSLDVSNNTALTIFACRDNQITALDVSNNTLLKFFSCHSNQLTSLDISQSSALVRLWCYNNLLTDLDLRNGNNTNISNGNFKTTNNPNLTCIEVDDSIWSTTNWTNIDTIASFNESCNTVSIDDFDLKNTCIVYPNPTKDSFKIDSNLPISKITIYNHLGKLILQFNSQKAYNVSLLADGIYFIQINSDNKIQQTKLIISSF